MSQPHFFFISNRIDQSTKACQATTKLETDVISASRGPRGEREVKPETLMHKVKELYAARFAWNGSVLWLCLFPVRDTEPVKHYVCWSSACTSFVSLSLFCMPSQGQPPIHRDGKTKYSKYSLLMLSHQGHLFFSCAIFFFPAMPHRIGR